jgi:hypothetical protein
MWIHFAFTEETVPATLSFLLLIPRLHLPLRLELIPRPNEFRRYVAILHLRRRHPLPPGRAAQVHDVEVVPLPAIIEGYRAPERQCAVVLQFRLEYRLMIADAKEFRSMGTQSHRAPRGSIRHESHVDDVERAQSQRLEHPFREEYEVVRGTEVDGTAHGAVERRRRRMVMLVRREGNAGGRHALDARYLE